MGVLSQIKAAAEAERVRLQQQEQTRKKSLGLCEVTGCNEIGVSYCHSSCCCGETLLCRKHEHCEEMLLEQNGFIPGYQYTCGDVPMPAEAAELIATEKARRSPTLVIKTEQRIGRQSKPAIKAIETHYKGYRFRSRLEARWAVFLDAIHLRWEYEKEGYQLSTGCYLPDFWLPDWNCWLEIKGVQPSRKECGYCEELGLGSDKACLIGIGLPGENYLLAFCSDCTDGSAGTGWWDKVDFASVKGEPTSICLDSNNDHSSRFFSSPSWNDNFDAMRLSRDCEKTSLLQIAYSAARSARFEHGETPRS